MDECRLARRRRRWDRDPMARYQKLTFVAENFAHPPTWIPFNDSSSGGGAGASLNIMTILAFYRSAAYSGFMSVLRTQE